MKADEYVESFMEVYKCQLADNRDERKACIDTIIIICQRLVIEAKAICLARKANCDSAWEAIIKEQNQKWRAIVRRLDTDRLPLRPSPDAFLEVWETFKKECRQK